MRRARRVLGACVRVHGAVSRAAWAGAEGLSAHPVMPGGRPIRRVHVAVDAPCSRHGGARALADTAHVELTELIMRRCLPRRSFSRHVSRPGYIRGRDVFSSRELCIRINGQTPW
jgi:hypothetical protein